MVGAGYDHLVGGSGDDIMIGSDDDQADNVDGGHGFDDCLVSAGD